METIEEYTERTGESKAYIAGKCGITRSLMQHYYDKDWLIDADLYEYRFKDPSKDNKYIVYTVGE